MKIRASKLVWKAFLATATLLAAACAQTPKDEVPPAGYTVDTAWPKPLPNNWILGQVAGIAVDARDHVWLIHRPKTIIDEEKGASFNPPRAKCCVPAPAVIEFDPEGNVVRAWGGPGQGYEWPENEHGIYIDQQGNVWVGGNDPKDHQLIKFTPEGKFLLQVGRAGQTGGSNSTTLLGRPAHMEIDAQANELYIADGYGNKRVLVLDAGSGAYKRHWGAYGKSPSDEKLPMHNPKSPQFANPVHCVRLSKDGLVYVCDRANNRVQVFRKDGTFMNEFAFEEKSLGSGSSFDLVFSNDPKQKFFFLADGVNDQVLTVERETGKVISSFGRPGRMAGQFLVLHNIGIDSKGNLYTAEVATGKRVQKFRPQER